jgi:hypothetical protein
VYDKVVPDVTMIVSVVAVIPPFKVVNIGKKGFVPVAAGRRVFLIGVMS